ncbi:uncharacterized protein LOC144711238 [Wolffia australiana]
MENRGGRLRADRLQFDRRYGWVIDEWREPSAEALAGGRGMFCILPILKALAEVSSKSADLAARSIVNVVEERGLVNRLTVSQPSVDLVEEDIQSAHPVVHRISFRR